ncbi:hypothetical protein VXS05_19250 [Photobacterium toruni]|uniref:hypothetical protein n=1 Tax=Photobacterium toruni TaxID=1935446 RepID=UPI002E19F686|nr:hypothetical protein [Photobacterium toruni]
MILKFVARFIHVLLWLKVVISPVLIGLVISVPICIIYDEINFYVIASFTVIGLIVGVIWAEKIRRTIGLSSFHGRLIATPEIDGHDKTLDIATSDSRKPL